MLEKQVVVERVDGEPARGKLVAVTGDTAVLVQDDGQVITVSRSQATKLSLKPAADPAEPPAESPVPADPNAPKSAEPATDGKPVPAKKTGEDEDFAKLGLFTAHGVSYAHWRTGDFREGAAAYALDFGVGYNFKKTVGLYGVIGGHVGAGLLDKSMRASLGHFVAMVRYNRKYFAFLGGLGLGWGGQRTSQGTEREVGVAIPLRFMGKIPLPKHFFLGLGAGYEPAFLRGPVIVNTVSLQLVIGRW